MDVTDEAISRNYTSLLCESDRGAVILGMASIDEFLEKLLRHYLAHSPEIQDTLFEDNGPLGTFRNKILISRTLGLIDTGMDRTLNLLRRIRNHCAHTSTWESLEEQKDRISELAKPLVSYPEFKQLTYVCLGREALDHSSATIRAVMCVLLHQLSERVSLLSSQATTELDTPLALIPLKWSGSALQG